MRDGRIGRWLPQVAVLVAGVVVAAYAVWVIRDVSKPANIHGDPNAHVRVSPPSAAATKPTSPPALSTFSGKAAKARTILVIGDSTGAGQGAWVDLLAQDLGKKKAVALHQWDDIAGAFATTPTFYGQGPRLDVWNLSYPGVENTYGQRLALAPKPDAILIDVGHDRAPAAVTTTMRVTKKAIRKRWGAVPTAWILQNSSTSAAAKQQEAAVNRLETMATRWRVPVIDVHAAFAAGGRLRSLLVDDSHPNADGSKLWARVVERALHP